jgi:hypothetical protein
VEGKTWNKCIQKHIFAALLLDLLVKFGISPHFSNPFDVDFNLIAVIDAGTSFPLAGKPSTTSASA